MPSSWIATWLDWRSITSHQGEIYAEGLPPAELPVRRGEDVARELGGRLLLRYVTERQLGTFRHGSMLLTYTTPTPYAPEEIVSWLVLPGPHLPRRHALLIDPAGVEVILGPQWVAMGAGIQYLLPRGFRPEAVVVPGAPDGRWEIEIR